MISRSLLILLCALLYNVKSARILGIFPMPSKSHNILGRNLMQGLADKGHDVTLISPLLDKIESKKATYRSIALENFKTVADPKKANVFDIGKLNFLSFIFAMNFLGNDVTERTLAHPRVQKLLQSNETFDVIIIEQFLNDALKGFAYHYGAHLVLFCTFGSNAWTNPLVGNPAPPSYVPEMSVTFNPANFLDRFYNTIVNVVGELIRHFLFFPAQNQILKRYFPDAPDLNTLLYNASLVLVNSHVSTNKAVPRVPSMIDIGGFHLNTPQKLPQDLQQYLDDAKEGVIYFSMGSVLASVNLPPEKRDMFLRVFSRLKQKVLWKWEADTLPNQPANVKLGKWLPQHDILAHPNIKLFITHAGLLSVIESIYHGVPLLAIPVFGDQTINALEIANNGCGRYIIYEELNEKKLVEAINDLLENKEYGENMRRRSNLMKDRRNEPIDDANYWIEYVIRHQGAPHLRVAGLELAWYEYLSLDVAAAVLTISLLILYLLFVLVKTVKNIACKKNNHKEKKG